MSTDYVPRKGDIIKVKVTLGKTSDQWWGYALGAFDLDALMASDLVELVARAEPDWQPGEIGQHTETGELFRYWPDAAHDPQRPDGTPWLDLQRYRDRLGAGKAAWRSYKELAGKLMRCTVTREE